MAELSQQVNWDKAFPGLTKARRLEQSLLMDPTFQAFYTMIQDDKQEELWKWLVTYQVYPPAEHVFRITPFVCLIGKTEPGKAINYEKLREDLNKARYGIMSGSELEKEVFDLLNQVVDAHIAYVRATTKVAVHGMYDMLIDRFYAKVNDPEFYCFLSVKVPSGIHQQWPDYEVLKQRNNIQLRAALVEHERAEYNIELMKSTTQFKVLLAKLETTLGTHYKSRHKQALLTNHFSTRQMSASQRSRYDRAQRKTEIERRNKQTEQNRISKNEQLKYDNLENIHQLGNSSRVCLPDSVITALVSIQDDYKQTLFEEDEKESEIAGLEVGNVHLGVEQMQTDYHLKDGEDEPLGGVVYPSGFVHAEPLDGGY